MTVPVAVAVSVPPIPVGKLPNKMRDKVVCTTGSVVTGVPRVIPETTAGMSEMDVSGMKAIIVAGCRLGGRGAVVHHKHSLGGG